MKLLQTGIVIFLCLIVTGSALAASDGTPAGKPTGSWLEALEIVDGGTAPSISATMRMQLFSSGDNTTIFGYGALTAEGLHNLTIIPDLGDGSVNGIYGIFAYGDLTYNGTFYSRSLGGDLLGETAAAESNVYEIVGFGSTGDIVNNDGVDLFHAPGRVTTTSGDATANVYDIWGFFSFGGSITNKSSLVVKVDAEKVDANGDETYTAETGTDSAIAYISHVYGISSDDDATGNPAGAVNNTGDVVVDINGADVASADGNVVNRITNISGIEGASITNTGDVTVDIEGGLAVSQSNALLLDAKIDNIHGLRSYSGVIDNSGTIDVYAGGIVAQGTANGDNTGEHELFGTISHVMGAHGVTVHNSGTVIVEAEGTEGYTIATSGLATIKNIRGVQADTQATNTGDIRVDVSRATATTTIDLGISNVAGLETVAGLAKNSDTVTVRIERNDEYTALPTSSQITLADIWGVKGTEAENYGTTSVTLVGEAQTTCTVGDVSGLFATTKATNKGRVLVDVEAGGDITTDATTYVAGIAVVNNDSDNISVVNDGTLSVTAKNTGGSDIAVTGIYMSSLGEKTLNSEYPITTTATGDGSNNAYHVYFGGNSKNILQTYGFRMTPNNIGNNLEGRDTIYSLYSGGSTKVEYGTLLVYPGNLGSGFAFNTYYRLPQLVDGEEPRFEAYEARNTELKAYSRSASMGGTEVSIGYVPQDTMLRSLLRAQQNGLQKLTETMHRQLTNSVIHSVYHIAALEPENELRVDVGSSVKTMLADSSTTLKGLGAVQPGVIPPEQHLAVFALPFINNSKDTEGMIGYKGDAYGVTLGGNYYLANRSVVGVHLGYTRFNMNFDGPVPRYNSRKDNQDIYSCGLQGLLSLTDNWYLRGLGTFFYIDHQVDGLGGVDGTAAEIGDFETYSVLASVLAGYHFNWSQNIVVPEIGIQYFYTYQKTFTTEADDDGSFDTTYSGFVDNELYLIANLRWAREIVAAEYVVTPTLGIGFQQVLTNGETEVSQSIPRADPVDFTVSASDQVYNVRASVTCTKGEGSVELGYTGSFAPHIYSHTYWLQAQATF